MKSKVDIITSTVARAASLHICQYQRCYKDTLFASLTDLCHGLMKCSITAKLISPAHLNKPLPKNKAIHFQNTGEAQSISCGVN